MTSETRYVVARKTKAGWLEYMRPARDHEQWTAEPWLACAIGRDYAEALARLFDGVVVLPVTLTVGEPDAQAQCWCAACQPDEPLNRRMILCAKCGNKRCPHATDHRNACTGSNEPGQVGSVYGIMPDA